MNVVKRVKAPTPKFFKLLRMIGLSLFAASGALVAEPVDLPEPVVKIAGYMAVAGGVMTAVSQTAVEGEEPPSETPTTDGGS